MSFSLRPAGEKVAWAQPMTDEGNAEVFAATTLKRPKPSPRRGEGGTAQP